LRRKQAHFNSETFIEGWSMHEFSHFRSIYSSII